MKRCAGGVHDLSAKAKVKNIISDGKIFVFELAECIRIRTGEEARESIG